MKKWIIIFISLFTFFKMERYTVIEEVGKGGYGSVT